MSGPFDGSDQGIDGKSPWLTGAPRTDLDCQLRAFLMEFGELLVSDKDPGDRAVSVGRACEGDPDGFGVARPAVIRTRIADVTSDGLSADSAASHDPLA